MITGPIYVPFMCNYFREWLLAPCLDVKHINDQRRRDVTHQFIGPVALWVIDKKPYIACQNTAIVVSKLTIYTIN